MTTLFRRPKSILYLNKITELIQIQNGLKLIHLFRFVFINYDLVDKQPYIKVMIVLMITYLPDKRHIVSKSADGAYKVYYKLSEDENVGIQQAIDAHTLVRVYHRENDDTNFTYLGESEYYIRFDVESECSILNIFYPPGASESRKLFTKDNDYVGAVARDCKFDGVVSGTLFEVRDE